MTKSETIVLLTIAVLVIFIAALGYQLYVLRQRTQQTEIFSVQPNINLVELDQLIGSGRES
jgi:hypothetical protein